MIICSTFKDYFKSTFDGCERCGNKCHFEQPFIMALTPYGVYIADVIFKPCNNIIQK